ncbi:MAG: glycoside hydrolase family 3 N-terminal domain-containing protein, partial [Planctomycetota bacterium]
MRNARLVVPGLRFPTDLEKELRLAERGAGGFCIFGGDARLKETLDRLQAAAPHPLLFASDMEEGAGQQIEGWERHPPAAALDPAAAEVAGIRTAVEARSLGLTMTFAPVCDVVSDPRNPIIQGRAFTDPEACAPRFVQGARRMGLRTCAKHFPGHGATREDSHADLPVVDAPPDTWRVRDLPPFAACIEAGVDAVMTAHIACPGLTGSPTLPATLSWKVITDLLRCELGFEGLVVTDALLMEGVRAGRGEAAAAVLALEAGCDALLCPADPEGVMDAIENADAGASLERMALAARPLPDPLAAAAAASVTTGGRLPVGPGPHRPEVCDLDGAEAAPFSAGLAVPALVILRSDR